MSKNTRSNLRKRISLFLQGGSRPRINTLNADTISVFKEYNLEARDFLSQAHQANLWLREHPDEDRSKEQLIYLIQIGKRL